MKIRKSAVSSKKNNAQRETKSNMPLYAGIVVYIILLVLRIPLNHFIGDEGVGVFAAAFEIFTLVTLLFSQGIAKTEAGMIRYRIKREQYQSARRVFGVSFRIAVLISIITGVIIFALSGIIADTLILEPMAKKAIAAAAPVIVLSAFVNVFRGYFNGNGFGILVVHSQYIEKIAMFILSVFGGRLMYDYGLKVSELLKFDAPAYSYAALGVMGGMMLSELLTLIYLLAVFAIYSGTWKKQLAQDTARRIESGSEIRKMLLGSSLPFAFIVIVINSVMLIAQRFFNYCCNRLGMYEQRAGLWGAYYGKFAVLIGIGAALVCLILCGHVSKIAGAYEKEEYRMMRDRLGNAVKSLCIFAFPITVFEAVMADAFVNGLYKGENEYVIGLVRQGSIVIFFYAAFYLFGQLMLKVHMAKEFLITLTVSFVLYIVSLFVMFRVRLMGAEGVVYSLIIFTGVAAVLCFVFISKNLKYRQEWLYSFIFPLLSACVSGLLAMLIRKALILVAGNILTILVSGIVAAFLYILFLMVLKVIGEAELSRIPLGGIWIMIGRMIGVL